MARFAEQLTHVQSQTFCDARAIRPAAVKNHDPCLSFIRSKSHTRVVQTVPFMAKDRPDFPSGLSSGNVLHRRLGLTLRCWEPAATRLSNQTPLPPHCSDVDLGKTEGESLLRSVTASRHHNAHRRTQGLNVAVSPLTLQTRKPRP